MCINTRNNIRKIIIIITPKLTIIKLSLSWMDAIFQEV